MYFRFASVAVAALLVGCGGGGGTSALGTMPPPSHGPTGTAYVGSSSSAGPGNLIQGYSLPLSATSAALFSALTSTTAFCADAFGHLFVVDAKSGMDVYTLPLTQNSTPSFKLATAHPGAGACASDSAGTLYVPEDVYNNDPFNPQLQGYIDVFAGPVHAGSTPVKTIMIPPQGNGSLTGINDATTDAGGDVFVNTAVAITGFSRARRSVRNGALVSFVGIEEFSSLAAGNSLLATFGGAGASPKIGPDGNLYTLDATSPYPFTAIVDVYVPSDFHNGGKKDHSITLGTNVSPAAIAFDNLADMYIDADLGSQPPLNAVVLMLPPPYAAIGVTMPLSSPERNGGVGSIVIVP